MTTGGALLPVAEVARRLRCSRQHVYNLIAAGRLRVVDIGGGRRPMSRVAESELERFAESNSRSARRGVR